MNILDEWIAPKYLKNVGALKKKFLSAKPFPHLFLADILIPAKAEMLAKALTQQTFTHKESDLFSLSQTADFETSSTKALKQFYEFACSEEFSAFMHELTGLSVKPGALDLAGSLYESGDYLLCHDDQVEDRKIAYIVYFSKGFTAKDGARFVLFDNKNRKPSQEAKAYPPQWNSMMLFEVSPLSFHAVEENCSAKDRFAIGGWLH